MQPTWSVDLSLCRRIFHYGNELRSSLADRVSRQTANAGPSAHAHRIGCRCAAKPAGELCATSTTQVLNWALPPPILRLPADLTSGTPRQLFNVQSVPGAEYYLFCFSKPGVACPVQPIATSNTIVAEVRGNPQYSRPNDLAQFGDQTVHWTAAACNAIFGCVYQQAVRTLKLTAPSLTCHAIGNEIQLRNGQYAARISRNTVGMSVTRLKPDGSADSVALSGDRIRLGFDAPLPARANDAHLTEVQVVVEKCYSFYARVSVVGKLDFPNLATFVVKRTYEFTRSPNIYAQMELRLERAFGPVRVLPEDSARVWSLYWDFGTDSRSRVLTTTRDLFVGIPDGPLGGLDSGLIGHHADARLIHTTGHRIRRVIFDHKMADGHSIVLLPSRVLLSNVVVAINSPESAPLIFSGGHYARYQLYPTFGMQDFDAVEKRRGENELPYRFNEWNSYKYAMEDISPINPAERNRQTEDALIRYTMFLIERLTLDQGWWTVPAWQSGETYYPRGDRGATHSRSFPALAYLWAYLTMLRTPAGWTHVPSDADFIYRELQKTYQYYINSDPAPNFADNTPLWFPNSPFGFPYIAYSAHHRERLGGKEPTQRVINAHSTALRFAWVMREASHLFGDSVREQQWTDVVAQYHRGSKELFRLVYPGKDPTDLARTYSGLIGYSPFQPDINMNYIGLTFEGMASGYLNAGEFEPEFADAVERASRQDFDISDGNKRESVPIAAYVAALARVFPAALAFTRPVEHVDGTCLPPFLGATWGNRTQNWGPDMSRELGAASLTEVLEYDWSRGKRIHNPAKFISEGNGRKWILTNTQFLSYWAPGFWEEVDSNQVPANARFDIRVTMPTPSLCLGNHYSAYRMGNKIFIMTDYSGGTMTLEFPGVQLPIVKRQIYNETTHRWDPEQVATDVTRSRSGGSVLVYLQNQRKALTIVEIQP